MHQQIHIPQSYHYPKITTRQQILDGIDYRIEFLTPGSTLTLTAKLWHPVTAYQTSDDGMRFHFTAHSKPGLILGWDEVINDIDTGLRAKWQALAKNCDECHDVQDAAGIYHCPEINCSRYAAS